jgi:hypothetical protein
LRVVLIALHRAFEHVTNAKFLADLHSVQSRRPLADAARCRRDQDSYPLRGEPRLCPGSNAISTSIDRS